MNGACGGAGQRGVTLVELLVTMSIAVILLTVGVSGMTTLFRTNARAADVNALVGYLNFARAQAILRGTNVVVCPVDLSDLAAGCRKSGTGTWADGYAVIEEDSGEALRVHSGSETLTMTSTVLQFRFRDDGTFTSGGPGQHITVCDARDDAKDNASRGRDVIAPVEIIVSGMGRVRVSDKDGDGDDPDCS